MSILDFFSTKPNSFLGIDIGTASIKVVQLKKGEEKYKLETYGEISTFRYLEKLNDPFQGSSLKALETITRDMLEILFEKSEVTAKHAVMAVPVFSSFTSIIEMPEMSEKELEKAVQFEAGKYIPIPLSEVNLDWEILDGGRRVLLIAVPKEVVNKYLKIGEDLNLRVSALELEGFSFTRSLIGEEKGVFCVLDIGARATSFTIIENGMIQLSHGLDVAGAEMTKTLATGLGVTFKRAEDFKLSHGLDHQKDTEGKKEVKELLIDLIDKIIIESERMISNYQLKTNKKIEKLILNGGSAQLLGLKDYIGERLGIQTLIADPWKKIVYPPALGNTLKELGPEFSVAVGAAMRK